MLSVDKVNKNLDDKKKEVVTTPLSEKKLWTTDKVTTSEEVDKRTEKLEDIKEAVVMICRKDSDRFEGQYKGYTGWFNLDHELKTIFYTFEPDFYKNLMK